MSANADCKMTTWTLYAMGRAIQCMGGRVEFSYIEQVHLGDFGAFCSEMEGRGCVVWAVETREVPVSKSRRNRR